MDTDRQHVLEARMEDLEVRHVREIIRISKTI